MLASSEKSKQAKDTLAGAIRLGDARQNGAEAEPSRVIPIVVHEPDSPVTYDFLDNHDRPSNESEAITHAEEPIDPSKPIRRHSSIFKEDIPENLELEFVRDGWSNRIITDKQGNELYFADIPWKWTGTQLDIYRRNSEFGGTVASLSRKSLNKRVFLHLNEGKERLKIVGSKLYLGFDYYFEYGGRQYRWREGNRGFRKCAMKGHDEVLIDVETKAIIARFRNVSPLQVWRKKRYGKLTLYHDEWIWDDKFVDVVVLTLVAVKQRIREKLRMRTLWKLIFEGASGAGS
jgi:hypothetical protein